MSETITESVAIVTTYLEKDGKSHQEALFVETQFNAVGENEDDSDLVRTYRDELLAALAAYQTQHPEALPFDLKNCSWDDVLEQMKRAQTEANDPGKGIRGFVRKATRKMAHSADVITPAFQMFPDDLCVLHGGLAVMFNIARYREDNRQKILLAFGEIPNTIEMAKRKGRIFPHDGQLADSIRSLEKTLLKTIPSLIGILVPKTLFGKTRTAFAKHQIDEALETITAIANRVRVHAEGLMDETMVTTKNLVLSNQESLNRTEAGIEQMRRALCDGMSKMEDRVKMLEATTPDIKTSLVEILVDEVLKRACSKQSLASSPSEPPGICTDEMLELLRFDFNEQVEDFEAVAKATSKFGTEAKALAYALLQVPQLCALLAPSAPGTPRLLLVDANLDAGRIGKISPVSYLGAFLSTVLSDVPGHVPISFFCGKYTDDDVHGGPRAMMRSLLGQLVCLLPRNGLDRLPGRLLGHQSADDHECRVGLESLRIDVLCHVFLRVLAGLPAGLTVFCIIDGVSYYNAAAHWQADMAFVWDTLLAACSGDRGPATTKVLMTCPGRTQGMEGLGQDRYVSWRKKGAFTAVKSDRLAQKRVDALIYGEEACSEAEWS